MLVLTIANAELAVAHHLIAFYSQGAQSLSHRNRAVVSVVGRAPTRLTRTLGWQLILLLAQFFLGLSVNLWTSLPRVHPGSHSPHYFAGLGQGLVWALLHANLLLRLHIILGILIWLLATHLLFSARRDRTWGITLALILAWIGITGAGFNGGSFLNYGRNMSSLLMSVGFALAVVCYVWAWGHTLTHQLTSTRIRIRG